MPARIFAVLAAALLIAAFAVGTLAPPDMPLGAALFTLNHDLLISVQAGIQRHLWPWVWDGACVPLLLRPAWLIPASLGIVSAGFALSLTSRPTHRSRRRS